MKMSSRTAKKIRETLTETAGRPVVGLYVASEKKDYFPSINEAARVTGIRPGHIHRCLTGERKSVHGMRFVMQRKRNRVRTHDER